MKISPARKLGIQIVAFYLSCIVFTTTRFFCNLVSVCEHVHTKDNGGVQHELSNYDLAARIWLEKVNSLTLDLFSVKKIDAFVI